MKKLLIWSCTITALMCVANQMFLWLGVPTNTHGISYNLLIAIVGLLAYAYAGSMLPLQVTFGALFFAAVASLGFGLPLAAACYAAAAVFFLDFMWGNAEVPLWQALTILAIAPFGGTLAIVLLGWWLVGPAIAAVVLVGLIFSRHQKPIAYSMR